MNRNREKLGENHEPLSKLIKKSDERMEKKFAMTNTVKIFQITCTKAQMIGETGTAFSLGPWGSNTPYYEGYDDGGKEYILPDGYHLAHNRLGEPTIYDAQDRDASLVPSQKGPRLVTSVDNVLLKEFKALSSEEALAQVKKKHGLDEYARAVRRFADDRVFRGMRTPEDFHELDVSWAAGRGVEITDKTIARHYERVCGWAVENMKAAGLVVDQALKQPGPSVEAQKGVGLSL